MDDRSLKVLEFYQLLEVLKTFSVSPLGRKRCEALKPSTDILQIQLRLAEVLELKEILETAGEIPIKGLKDVEEILRRLEVEGSILVVHELIDIYNQIDLCKGLKRFFQKLKVVEASHLQEKISKLSSLKTLEKEILQAINTKGEILDRASPTLKEIRRQLGEVRERAKGLLEHLLPRPAVGAGPIVGQVLEIRPRADAARCVSPLRVVHVAAHGAGPLAHPVLLRIVLRYSL